MKEKFDRGTALSIFKSDRYEDLVALIVSMGIALLVYIYI
jgi:hypothetical protein